MPIGKKSVGIEPDVWRILQERKLDTGRDIYEQIRDLVLAEATPPELTARAAGGDDGDNLCSMVRACVRAGHPWDVVIRGVVVPIYEKMLRES